MADKEDLSGPTPTDKETALATTSHPLDEEIAARSKQTQKRPGRRTPNLASHQQLALTGKSEMVPFNILQCPHPRNLQLPRPRHLGGNELSWRWR